MTLEVKSVTLLLTDGADIILLSTDLPSGVYPFEGSAQFQLQVAKDQGANYIVKHFSNVPGYTIDIRE